MLTEKQYNDRKTEAKRLGISESTLIRRYKDMGFPFIRFGKRILFDPQLSDEFMAAHTHNGRAAELAKAA